MLHKGARRAETSKTMRETEAEAVSFIITRAIGLDTGSAACDYIQLYNGDAETLASSLEAIQKASHAILTAIQSAGMAETIAA
jgi:hypothetical protein